MSINGETMRQSTLTDSRGAFRVMLLRAHNERWLDGRPR